MAPANIAVLVVLLAVFYLLLVRPQKRRLRQHQDLVNSLAPGDEIVTIGGVIGYIKEIGDEAISVEIAPDCVIRVARQAIGRKVPSDIGDLDDIAETDEPADSSDGDLRDAPSGTDASDADDHPAHDAE